MNRYLERFGIFTFGVVLGWLTAPLVHGATLSVPLPDGCVPQVSAYTVSCAPGTTPPPVTPPPTTPPPAGDCKAAGYATTSLELAYPTHGNTQLATTGTFGNANAIVVHFKTPPMGVNDVAVFQPAGLPPSQNTNRVYVLGLVPCLFGPDPSAITVISSQSPTINIHLGTCVSTIPALCAAQGTWLQPSTDYYVTMVNRTAVNGQPSCTFASCPMRLDFNQ